jgi:uncharacterized protein YciI
MEFLILLRPIRETFPGDATPAELAVIGEHFKYLQVRLKEGKLILAGRTQVEQPIGLCVTRADSLEEATQFMNEDPAIQKGIFRGELFPYQTALLVGRD